MAIALEVVHKFEYHFILFLLDSQVDLREDEVNFEHGLLHIYLGQLDQSKVEVD